MNGPGLTVLQGYEGANTAQRQGQESQLRQGVSALQLADAVQKMQHQALLRKAFETYGDSQEALEGELVKRGALREAEQVGKMRRETAYQDEIKGALTTEGEPDWKKIAMASLKHGQSGPALSAMHRADITDQKRTSAKQAREGMMALAGTPGGSLGGTATGSVSETSEQGRMLAEQFPEEPVANRAAINEGIQTVAPAKKGALDQYENAENPAVRRQAAAVRAMLASGVMDPKDAARQIGSLAGADVKVGIEADKEEGRSTRAEARQDEIARWDSKRGVGITRGGRVVLPEGLPALPAGSGPGGSPGGSDVPKATVHMRERIRVLVEGGMPLQEAQLLVGGGGGAQVSESQRLRLAQGLMSLKKDDLVTPLYASLGEALDHVNKAIDSDRAKRSGPALPPPPNTMPGSFSAGSGGALAAPGSAPASGLRPVPPAAASGLPQGSKQIGTSKGKPVYQSPDGKQYIVD